MDVISKSSHWEAVVGSAETALIVAMHVTESVTLQTSITSSVDAQRCVGKPASMGINARGGAMVQMPVYVRTPC